MTPYLTHKDQRVLLVPMEPQPESDIQIREIAKGVLAVAYWAEGKAVGSTCPIRVGDEVPVREEWAQGLDGRIFYKSDSDTDTGECAYEIDGAGGWGGGVGTTFIKDWQPAETMPDFAVRYWRRATKVEAVEVEDALSSNSEWLLEIHVEPEEGE